MNPFYKHLILTLLVFSSIPLYPSNALSEIDSIKAEGYLNEIKKLNKSQNYNEALLLINEALKFADSLELKQYKFQYIIERGAIYRDKGSYIEAINTFNNILSNCNDSSANHITVLIHIGALYRHKGDYPAALDSYYKALRIMQITGITKPLASAYNNIGVILLYQKEHDKALEYFNKALEIYKVRNVIAGIGIANLNIGEVYRKKNRYNEAISHYLNALVYMKQMNDLDGIGTIYNELAGINIEQGVFDNVPQYLQMSMNAFTKQNSKLRISECEINYGNYAVAIKQFKSAIEHYNKALMLADNSDLLEIQSTVTKKMSETYELIGNNTLALNYYKKHIAIRDSIYNNENTRKSIEAELFYKFDQQQQEKRIEQAKIEAAFQAKSDKQRIAQIFLDVVILLMLVIVSGAFILLKKNRKATHNLQLHQQQIQIQNDELQQKQEEIIAQRDEIQRNNEVLSNSKKIISEKNERMVNSIEYAQTIQKALLPKDDYIKKALKEYFIIYRPKDIVSGDFYWVNVQSNFIDIAVMDCTGHGVPGAFMSLIGNTLLNQIVKEWQIHNPVVILENFDEMLRKLLQQDEKKTPIHSSIDIGLLSIDINQRVASFSGANRPLLYFQNGKLELVNSSLRSVGEQNPYHNTYFKNTEISLNTDTLFYLTTDGYADQMNEGLKKFGQRKLHNLLLEIQDKPMYKQHEILVNTYENYKGSEEQIDDVCIFGLKISANNKFNV